MSHSFSAPKSKERTEQEKSEEGSDDADEFLDSSQ